MEIKIQNVDETTFLVTVAGRATTTHTVTLAAAYCEKLTGGKLPPEELIRRSFEFLLEREPNTSILRRFDLPLIQTYFPEYEKTIRGVTG
jgi:hypothetical protein